MSIDPNAEQKAKNRWHRHVVAGLLGLTLTAGATAYYQSSHSGEGKPLSSPGPSRHDSEKPRDRHQPGATHTLTLPGTTELGAVVRDCEEGLPLDTNPIVKVVEDFEQQVPVSSHRISTLIQELATQGTAAIPVMRQFLRQNKDVILEENAAAGTAQPQTLRRELFDLLREAGGPDAEALLDETLRTTADPGEVSLLAHSLEELAPGQHRESILTAARESLSQVSESGRKVDVGPVFRLLQTHGDASVAEDLQKLVPEWRYYSLITLAGLPDGQGLLVLTGEARTGGRSPNGAVALRLLAQMAPGNNDASSRLIEQAQARQIPDPAWIGIAEALAGDRLELMDSPDGDSGGPPPARTFHFADSEETFCSRPAPQRGDELVKRHGLIEQLLAVAPTSEAVEALTRAKRQLAN